MLKGNNLILSINGTPLGAARTCGIDRNTDTIEVCSPVDGSSKQFIPTTTSWSISAGGLYANVYGAERLRKIWRDYQNGIRTGISVAVETAPGFTEQGTAILTSLHEQGDINSLVKFSIQLQGSGPLRQEGTPLSLTLALNNAHIEYGGDGIILQVDDYCNIDYVNINSPLPFILSFESVDIWMLLPGTHDRWEQNLDHYDEYGDMSDKRVGDGGEGDSQEFAAGQYVLYACNQGAPVRVKIIPQ